MLSREDNELLCRVGRGTPMGDLLRHYWMPCLPSTELPAADSTLWIAPGPVRPAPDLAGVEVHVIGDASGTSGIAAGLRAAADLVATL